MKRFKEAVAENHFLANLKYKGKHLSEADEEAARQLLLKLHPEHPEVIADLCAFTAGSELQTHFQLHFYHPHMLIKRRTLCGGRLCQTANVKCHHL